MHEKEHDKDGSQEVSIQYFDQLAKAKSVPFALSLKVTIVSITAGSSCHNEEVEGKADVLADEHKAEKGSDDGKNWVGEFGGKHDFISTKSEKLVAAIDEHLVVTLDVHTQKLFNCALRVH